MGSLINHLNEIDDDAAQPASELIEEEGTLRTFTLRRTGKRPLRFQGWQIVQASGSQASPVAYDINLYETEAGAFVAELLAHRDGAAERDVARVEVFDSLDAAATWLEGFSPAADLPVAQDLVNGETPLAIAALQVVRLRQGLRAVEDEYRALVSEVLDSLEVAEPPTRRHDGAAAFSRARDEP